MAFKNRIIISLSILILLSFSVINSMNRSNHKRKTMVGSYQMVEGFYKVPLAKTQRLMESAAKGDKISFILNYRDIINSLVFVNVIKLESYFDGLHKVTKNYILNNSDKLKKLYKNSLRITKIIGGIGSIYYLSGQNVKYKNRYIAAASLFTLDALFSDYLQEHYTKFSKDADDDSKPQKVSVIIRNFARGFVPIFIN